MFNRVVLINLKRRADRLANFNQLCQATAYKTSGLPAPSIFNAIEGDKVGIPHYFRSGGAAWGCARSHITCLESAIMDGCKSILVLEDDVTWMSDAWDRLAWFMERVPADWDQLMLGGQHIKTPTIGTTNDPRFGSVVRCNDCQRTHAYAIRGKAIQSLLKAWYVSPHHIDWTMGGWQRDWKVYAPDPFIFGQAGGKSDISGTDNPAKFWNRPDADIPIVYLECPEELLPRLRGLGIHTGYERTIEGLDKGLEEIAKLQLTEQAPRLRNWLDTLLWEAASREGTAVGIYHYRLAWETIRSVCPRATLIQGQSYEECVGKLREAGTLKALKKSIPSSHLLLLRSTRAVAENLTGFHLGYWKDEVTGQDNGVRKIAALPEREQVQELKGWIAYVGAEAERIGSVPCLWCDEKIRALTVRQATSRHVCEIVADSVEMVRSLWDDLLDE